MSNLNDYGEICPKCGSLNVGTMDLPFVRIAGTRTLYVMRFCKEDGCEHDWDEMYVFIKNVEPTYEIPETVEGEEE